MSSPIEYMQSKKKEIWKSIREFPHYAISNYGRVKRIAMPVGSRRSKAKLNGLLRPGLVHGYPSVRLHSSPNVGKTKKVHKLVADTFLPNTEKKLEVNHIDGNKQNNHFLNLEWVTHQVNAQHASRIGLMARGERSGKAKLTGNDVCEILNIYYVINKIPKWKKFGFLKYLASFYGVSHGTIDGIIRKRIWKHLH